MNCDYEAAALASNQAGYLGHKQANGLGLSDAAIQRRVRNGTLESVRKGLYRVPGITGDYTGLLRAAMAYLPDPTVSHESAAEIHGIPYVPRGKAAVTVHASTSHDFPGVNVHRSLDLIDSHRLQINSLWTTNPARTLNDLAAVVHPDALALALDDSLTSKLVRIDEVEKVFQEVARRGRNGCGAMRKLLKERLGDEMITASRLERLGFQVFERGGLPRPQWQYPAPWNADRRIDFAWPHVCVGCECDGRRWHTRVADFQKDRSRDNMSLSYNWRIFRYTWEDFTKRPDMVVAQLRDAIRV